jgi:hypothetical protein
MQAAASNLRTLNDEATVLKTTPEAALQHAGASLCRMILVLKTGLHAASQEAANAKRCNAGASANVLGRRMTSKQQRVRKTNHEWSGEDPEHFGRKLVAAAALLV